jgi:signal peptidase I
MAKKSSRIAEPPVESKPEKAAKFPKETPAKEPFGDWVKRQIAEWTVTIVMLLFGTTTLVQAFVVPTGSMESTLLIGDHLFVDKMAYAPPGAISGKLLPYTEVKRGDIIVFRYPPDIRQNYVKRVMGVPGDRIKIVNKKIILNGKTLDESYTQYVRPYVDPYADNFPSEPNMLVDSRAREMLGNHVVNGELVVPPGNYFAMGDNRDNSADSRYWGFVPRENIVGKPAIIFWSFDAPTDRLASGNIDPAHIFDIITNFFTKTRWKRQFMLIRGQQVG